jgi:two-component system, NarL family, nitrate/nitrite response regulator NarP
MSVVLCCKDPLTREALQSLLKHEGGFRVMGCEQRVTAALSAAKVQRATAVVVDGSGLEGKDLDRLSAARSKTSIYIVLLADIEPGEAAFGKVADRFVCKSQGSGSLFQAIDEIVNRRRVQRVAVKEVLHHYGEDIGLTPREHEVARKVALGMSNRDISEILDLKEQTVKNLVSVIMRKLNCKNRVQVALRLSNARPEEAPAQ